MATITVTDTLRRTGGAILDFTNGTAAPAATLSFRNRGREMLIIYNGDASPITATVEGEADLNGRSADVAHAIGATKGALIGPFKPEMFNNAGVATVTLSATTSVKYYFIDMDPTP